MNEAAETPNESDEKNDSTDGEIMADQTVPPTNEQTEETADGTDGDTRRSSWASVVPLVLVLMFCVILVALNASVGTITAIGTAAAAIIAAWEKYQRR
ncbi:hypothetical protein [Actinacidiphila guanduensis]|uniref:hypothetical protein n=1 Tax=Actinacidiphila guanduensis TaxID=310781 RepID=UPI00115FB38C|nr:hypothetical protein [Actinacidiphila guanduensis]